MTERLEGIGVSPGVALGTVHRLHAEDLPVVPAPIPPERVDDELRSFEEALENARVELRGLKHQVAEALGEAYAGILEAQLLILDDARLREETRQRIKIGRVSARWALREVVAESMRLFEAIEDPYLRERGGDLADVHRRIQRLLRGRGATAEHLPDEGPLVIVAHALAPSDVAALTRSDVVGLATDVGGPTSHTAILAQALSVPAVAGLHDVSRRARDGDTVIVDGDRGEVLLLPDALATDAAHRRREDWIASQERAMEQARQRPAQTADGVPVTLRANIEFAGEVPTAVGYGAEGIGLYRSEFLFLSHSPDLPGEEDHYRTYRDIARGAAPHPVVVRTLDLGGEKYFHEVLDRNEPNPVLGLRAIRFCLKRPDIFRLQLRGLLRAGVEPNLKIMLPLVTSPDEVRQVRALIATEAAALRSEGREVRESIALGVMIEVPAAALAADLLADEADFLALGTNDLIQYALAVDRGNESVSYLYQPSHPGVLRMLERVVEASSRTGVPLSVCGEMAADPDGLRWLLGLGVREFSVQPRALGKVREVLAGLDTARARDDVQRLLGGGDARGGVVRAASDG